MALTKQPVNISFSKGIDTKSDPFQIASDNFNDLNNAVFDKVGRLTKRNGFKKVTALPNAKQTTLTKLNENLIATGSSLYAYSQDTDQWLNRGIVQPIGLDVQSLVRVSTSQTAPDMAVAANGLACLVYIDSGIAYYQISDSATGQQVIQRTALPSNAASPRVFLLNRYFMVTYIATVTGTPHLQYIAIPIAKPGTPGTATDISAVVNGLTADDAYIVNNALYVAWAVDSTTIRVAYISSTLILSSPTTIAAHTATLMSVTADTSASTAAVWVSFWDSTSTSAFTAAFSQTLAPILTATQIFTGATLSEMTGVATNGVVTIIYETLNTYGYTPNARTDYLSRISVPQAGSVGGTVVILRSVGLASKAFIDPSGTIYMIATYGEVNQPTYFLIDSTGAIYMRLAYSNGGGYSSTQVLANVNLVNGVYYTPYLIKDFLASVNKGTALPSGTPTNGIYTQTGINLAKFTINADEQYSSEIAGALHLTGGQLWEYDGVRPVEHGFHVWPENVTAVPSTTGGTMTAGTYYYAFTYEWTDNAGMLHRSAPSIPVSVTTTGSTSSVTLNVPTLRLTYKLAPNPVRIVGYRWSAAQPVYYQFTSITSPIVNDPTADSVVGVDVKPDSAILGQTLLYTTGGVIENIAAPASKASALYKNRLFLIDAEDPNLLWYSKQVIEAVPVEMSDLLTIYVAPTSGAQGSTGSVTALSALDDKLIIFKRDAIYYLTGTGPDSTGASNDFSDPIYITASVGCTNPNSIVLMPSGIMFQSDKGIWLLGRDLSTSYIGSPVDRYNDSDVMSAQSIPATNQVRFILDNGVTLMYDYFMSQWGTFNNISAISATIYQLQQTYLNSRGEVYQETPGTYVDGSNPVLMSFTTAWINLAGIQGLERFYFANLLGTYITPFKLNVTLAYNYVASDSQSIIVTPDANYAPAWGGEAQWGSGAAWGGSNSGNVFTARIFPQVQKCSSFQITIDELYDPSYGVPAGEGLTLSGLALTVGIKRGYRTQSASKSYG